MKKIIPISLKGDYAVFATKEQLYYCKVDKIIFISLQEKVFNKAGAERERIPRCPKCLQKASVKRVVSMNI